MLICVSVSLLWLPSALTFGGQMSSNLSIKLNHGVLLSESDISEFDLKLGTTNEIEPQRINFHMEPPDENNSQGIGFRFEASPSEKPVEKHEQMEQPDGYRRAKSLRILNEFPQLATGKGMRIKLSNISDTKNFPYMAAIIINGRLWCAGSLVDENWVLTAAHCLNFVLHVSPVQSLGNYVKVRVGSSRPHEGGKLVNVVGAVRHPKFEEEPVPHADVALLKLSTNLRPFFDRRLNIIKIYEGVKEPYAQSFIQVAGWGATRGTDTAFRDHTPTIGTARLKVRTAAYCMDAYQLVNGFRFTPDFFCASLRNGTRDLCLFDAGAPAIQQNQLRGIMSFGPERCGHEFQPAVFIKAFYFKDFVKATISSYKTTEELIEAMQAANPEREVDRYIRSDEDQALKHTEE